jgi:hypothetical protein
MDKISKLSKAERRRLIEWQDLMDWKPQKPLSLDEIYEKTKKLRIGINKDTVAGTKKK